MDDELLVGFFASFVALKRESLFFEIAKNIFPKLQTRVELLRAVYQFDPRKRAVLQNLTYVWERDHHFLDLLAGLFYNSGQLGPYKKTVEFSYQAYCEQFKGEFEYDWLDATPWAIAIGHYTYTDLFLKGKKLGFIKDKRTVLVDNGKIANHPMQSCFAEFVEKTTKSQLESRPGRWANMNVFELQRPVHKFSEAFFSHALINGEWLKKNKGEPLLKLPVEIQEKGTQILAKMGIGKGAWFATVHVRGGGFRNDGVLEVRNADINTYLPAIHSIIARGGYVIRMGDKTMPPLPKVSGLVDYALGEFKSELMDVFLCAKTNLHIGTLSGLSTIPGGIFNRPTLYTNLAPVGGAMPFSPNLYIPKLLRKKSGVFLKISEYLEDPFIVMHSMRRYRALGIDVIDNTSEDINDLVLDYFDVVENDPRAFNFGVFSNLSSSQKRIQERVSKTQCIPYAVIGRRFLDKHPELL